MPPTADATTARESQSADFSITVTDKPCAAAVRAAVRPAAPLPTTSTSQTARSTGRPGPFTAP